MPVVRSIAVEVPLVEHYRAIVCCRSVELDRHIDLDRVRPAGVGSRQAVRHNHRNRRNGRVRVVVGDTEGGRVVAWSCVRVAGGRRGVGGPVVRPVAVEVPLVEHYLAVGVRAGAVERERHVDLHGERAADGRDGILAARHDDGDRIDSDVAVVVHRAEPDRIRAVDGPRVGGGVSVGLVDPVPVGIPAREDDFSVRVGAPAGQRQRVLVLDRVRAAPIRRRREVGDVDHGLVRGPVAVVVGGAERGGVRGAHCVGVRRDARRVGCPVGCAVTIEVPFVSDHNAVGVVGRAVERQRHVDLDREGPGGVDRRVLAAGGDDVARVADRVAVVVGDCDGDGVAAVDGVCVRLDC